VISGFYREVGGNCAVLGYYEASSGNLLSTIPNNLSPHPLGSRIQGPCSLKMGPIGFPKLR